MKKFIKICASVFLVAVMALSLIGCPDEAGGGNSGGGDGDISFTRIRFERAANSSVSTNATRGTPASTPGAAKAGSISIQINPEEEDLVVRNPVFSVTTAPASGVKIQYAVNNSTNFGGVPASIADGDVLWVKATSGSTALYCKINVKVGRVGEGSYIEGMGIPDPEFMAKYSYYVFPNLAPDELLTEDKLPDPSHWNTAGEVGGHKHAYPDPFHFANGNRVTNLKDWENRRKEMKLIMTYYQKGRVPSVGKDVLEITLSGQNNRDVSLIHKASGRTAEGSCAITANPSATISANYGKLGYNADITPAQPVGAGDNMVLAGTAIALSRGAIETLYGLPANTMTRDSAGAWNASIVLTIIEGVDDSGEMQYFHPTPAEDPEGPRSWFTTKGALSGTGISTWGKFTQALVFAEGRNGSRFGWANIGDSGAVGAAIERFISPAGFRMDITAQEALSYSGFSQAEIDAIGLPANLKNTKTGTSPRGSGTMNYGWPVDPAPIGHIGVVTRDMVGSLGGYQDFWGYPYYLWGIVSGNKMYGDHTSINHTYTTNTADRMVTARGRVVRGWSPYLDAFYPAPAAGNSTAIAGAQHTNTRVPYVAIWSPHENWSGIQNTIQARGENQYDWQNITFRGFDDLHNGMDLDFARGQSGRGVEGFCCTMPHDTYFANMLLAPYGSQIIAAGSAQMRTNQPSTQANWMITDEIYKFYGEQEYFEEHGAWIEDPEYPGSGLYMGWDKYIWRNLHDLHWGGHEGTQSGVNSTLSEHRARIFKEEDYGTNIAKTSLHLAQLRTPFFPVDDPVTYLGDYHKMDWGRPKGGLKSTADSVAGANDSQNPTIATRIQRRVYPILKDYFMGEVYHAVPAVSGTPHGTYHDEVNANYTPTGPKFKPMDWRGLIDKPEPLE